MAKKLTEIPHIAIAVIEPDGFYKAKNGNYSQIPFWSTMYVESAVQYLTDWELDTVPQLPCFSINFAGVDVLVGNRN